MILPSVPNVVKPYICADPVESAETPLTSSQLGHKRAITVRYVLSFTLCISLLSVCHLMRSREHHAAELRRPRGDAASGDAASREAASREAAG